MHLRVAQGRASSCDMGRSHSPLKLESLDAGGQGVVTMFFDLLLVVLSCVLCTTVTVV